MFRHSLSDGGERAVGGAAGGQTALCGGGPCATPGGGLGDACPALRNWRTMPHGVVNKHRAQQQGGGGGGGPLGYTRTEWHYLKMHVCKPANNKCNSDVDVSTVEEPHE